jgi:ketosteroid isomerase-like protein
MKKLFTVMATLFVLAASGCAPQVDVEAEADAIRSMSNEWLNAARAKDVDRIMADFSADASVLAPNAPIATGTEAIRQVWSDMVESPGFAVDTQVTKVEVARAGDLAYALGTYELTTNDPEGNPVTDRGKWVAVGKKEAGAWKWIADIWNSDQPATSATD